ncbi:retron St85 family effector protein [Labrys neptuniae]|uniref:Retron St85 family effector protein n=1 Tax=Labrys neptuniae TaxID=376174 RepID=A0ABV3PHY3_9HYPH
MSEAQKSLRRRVIQFFHDAYKVHRDSNIVFVCGGNSATDMRVRFRAYAEIAIPEYDIFQPEFAMENLFSNNFPEPFDIADFESLVGSLSRGIVIFPEAAGSYAETGYFSAKEELCKKILLVLDSSRQKDDSFISLGPAKKIGQHSIFHPVIQIDYKTPNFEVITERLKRIKLKNTLKMLKWNELSDLSDFEWLCLTHEIVNFLTIATIDDIKFIFNAMSGAHLSLSKLHQVASILVGSKHLLEYGDFGHLRVNPSKQPLLELSDGKVSERHELRLELANLYQDEGWEFKALVDGLPC